MEFSRAIGGAPSRSFGFLLRDRKPCSPPESARLTLCAKCGLTPFCPVVCQFSLFPCFRVSSRVVFSSFPSHFMHGSLSLLHLYQDGIVTSRAPEYPIAHLWVRSESGWEGCIGASGCISFCSLRYSTTTHFAPMGALSCWKGAHTEVRLIYSIQRPGNPMLSERSDLDGSYGVSLKPRAVPSF